MPPFITLDGYAVPVSIATPSRRIKTMGRRARSFRGQHRDSRRGARRMWDCEACYTRISDRRLDAEAFKNVVDGKGHLCFMSEGFNCSTGLNPLPGYGNARFDFSAAVPAFPDVVGRLTTTGAGIVAKWDAQVDDMNWTFGVWDNDGGWVLKTRTGDGRSFRGTVADPLILTSSDEFSIEVKDGVFIFRSETGAGQVVDDAFMLPFLASNEQIAAWSALTRPMGPKPVMRMEGTLVEEEWVYVVGQVTGSTFINKPTNIEGFGWVSNAEVVKFTLFEVPADFVIDDQIPGWDGQLASQGST